MVRSMFAGVAGLRAHQSKMDVIGNNIANVNTWGFKAGSMSFKDAMYQNSSSGSGGSTEAGGLGAVNANQIGYGVTTGAITYDFSTGSMSPSANGLDCMIQGTGFFIVGPMISGGSLSLSGDDAVKSSGLYLSRVGKFKVDPQGYLVDDSGSYVYGFQYNQDSKDYATGSLVPLQLPTQEALNIKKGNTSATRLAEAKKQLVDSEAAYNSQNAKLSIARQEYVTAQSKYQSLSDQLKIDELEIELTAKKVASTTAYNALQNASTDKDDELKKAYYEKLEEYQKADYELILLKAQLKAPNALKDAEAVKADLKLYFSEYQTALVEYRKDPDKKGDFELAEKALNEVKKQLSALEDDSLQGIRDAAKIKVSMEAATLEAAENTVKNAKANLVAAQTNAAKSNSNSGGSGSNTDDSHVEFANYKIQTDGTITGITSDSESLTIGKIALGRVQNMGGLEKESGYYYTVGASAGNVSVFQGGGTDGVIKGNFLEMAQVDLATEMTDMITTQRGFQANSKIITVTDQMLEELVNMKR